METRLMELADALETGLGVTGALPREAAVRIGHLEAEVKGWVEHSEQAARQYAELSNERDCLQGEKQAFAKAGRELVEMLRAATVVAPPGWDGWSELAALKLINKCEVLFVEDSQE